MLTKNKGKITLGILFVLGLILGLVFAYWQPPSTIAQSDIDGDGIPDNEDNCPEIFNPNEKTFTETFETEEYKDAGNTTADWNTISGKVQLYETDIPFSPQIIGNAPTLLNGAVAITVKGNYAYVGEDTENQGVVNIFDVSDPTNPQLIGNTGIRPEEVHDLEILGNHAYVAHDALGFMIFDISNPSSPVQLGSRIDGNFAFSVYIDEDTYPYAYVSYIYTEPENVVIYDVSNPLSISLVATYDASGDDHGLDVYVKDNKAYVLTGYSHPALDIVDVSNPSSPQKQSAYELFPYGNTQVVGNLVYTATGDEGLRILDASDPTSPQLIGNYTILGKGSRWRQHVDVQGNFAYLVNGDKLYSLNISDPTNPTLVSEPDLPGTPTRIDTQDNIAYIAAYESGLQIVKLYEEEYISPAQAQSTQLNPSWYPIDRATLYTDQTLPPNTSIDYWLTADGSHFEPVTPSQEHFFTHTGKDLKWKAELKTDDPAITPLVDTVSIHYRGPADQTDQDSDGLGDACDNCPLHSNPNQEDIDCDSLGNLCDPECLDIDCDGRNNSEALDSSTLDYLKETNVGEEVIINLTLSDACGNRLASKEISATSSREEDIITRAQSPAGSTDTEGKIEIKVSSTKPGTSTISFFDETDNINIPQQTEITFLSTTPAKINLLADPLTLNADSTSTSTITAEVLDSYDNLVSDGTRIKFEITEGMGSLSSDSAVTKEGEAQIIYTAGTEEGTVKIKAASDSISGEVELTLLKPQISLTKSVKIETQASVLGAAISSFFTFPTWLLALALVISVIIFVKKKRNPHPDGRFLSIVFILGLALILSQSLLFVRLTQAFEDQEKEVKPGHTLIYKMAYQNISNTSAEDVVIIDSIPSGSSYLTSSLNINGTSKTDALDSDQADFNQSNFKACTFNLGTVAKDASGYVTFQVKVNDPKEVDAIANQAQVNFNPGEFTAFSNTVSNPAKEEALLSIPAKGSIGDLVFKDSNRDEKYTEGETEIAGVTLKLYQDTDHDANLSYTQDKLLKTTVTSSEGTYDFLELDTGVYIVDLDETSLPTDYQLTTNNEPLYLELAKDQDFNEADFGYTKKETAPLERRISPVKEVPEEIPPAKPIPTKKAEPKIEILPTKPVGPKIEITPVVPKETLSEKVHQGTVNIIKTILPEPAAQFYEKRIIQNKTVQTTIQSVAVPIVTATSVGITAITITTTSIAFGPYLIYLWQFLLSPLAILSRKRRKAWGVVYNSLTKQPVDLAMVRLWDGKTKKLLQTKVTGRDGRYIFMVDPKKEYYVTVTKPNYEYPSRLLEKAAQDTTYQDLYYHQIITVDPTLTTPRREKERIVLPQATINLNIPLDPKSQTVFAPGLSYSSKSKINSVSDFLGLSREKRTKENQALISSYKKAHQRRISSSLGPIFGFVCFILSPSIYTILLFIVQFLAYFLFRRLALRFMPKPWGKVKDQATEKGLGLAILRLFDKRYGRLLLTQVTPHEGRYGFLVGKEEYILTCERQGYQAPPKLEILGTKEGMVKKDVNLRRFHK